MPSLFSSAQEKQKLKEVLKNKTKQKQEKLTLILPPCLPKMIPEHQDTIGNTQAKSQEFQFLQQILTVFLGLHFFSVNSGDSYSKHYCILEKIK